MVIRRTLAAIAAAWLASAAARADVLPAGTPITGQVGGAATTLLGLDHGFADEAGSTVTALSAGELEYLTGDFAVGVDFFTDGRVQVWNNSGTALLPGSYAPSFDFAGGPALAGFEPLGPVGGCVVSGTRETGTGTGGCGSDPPPWSGACDGGATDMAGCREFGSMDLAGAPLDVSGRLGVAPVKVNGVATDVVLANLLGSDVGLATRAEVFQNSTIATGAPGGWVPAP